jgi:HprK-related kinase A
LPDQRATTLADMPCEQLAHMLRTDGICIDLGLIATRLRSDVPLLAEHLRSVYRHFPCLPGQAWADLHVLMHRARGLRRWWRPQVQFVADTRMPFAPFPADTALPMFEWGSNWLIAQRMNDSLLLHAGVLERDGKALILPAAPGSGKSTLTAALCLRGWRLLSDEFGAFDPELGAFRPVLKPVALKNQSIEVIRSFEPGAELGPIFPKTRKGTVAHLAPPLRAVQRRHQSARPGMLVLPRWQLNSPTQLEPLPARSAFSAVAFHAFNYAITGAAGFRAAARLARECPAWRLVYSDLDDALRKLDDLWAEAVAPANGFEHNTSALAQTELSR